MRSSQLLVCLLFLSGMSLAQTRIGLDFSINSDKYKVEDPGKLLSPPKVLNMMPGLNLAFRLNPRWELYAGAYLKGQKTAVRIDNMIASGSSDNMAARVPLLFACRLPVVERYLWFSVFAGAQVHKFFQETGSTRMLGLASTRSIEISASTYYSGRLVVVPQAGIDFNYRFARRWVLTTSFSYLYGLSVLQKDFVSYNVNNTGSVMAYQTADGSGFVFGLLKISRVIGKNKDIVCHGPPDDRFQIWEEVR